MNNPSLFLFLEALVAVRRAFVLSLIVAAAMLPVVPPLPRETMPEMGTWPLNVFSPVRMTVPTSAPLVVIFKTPLPEMTPAIVMLALVAVVLIVPVCLLAGILGVNLL